jgi:hypothetical protein
MRATNIYGSSTRKWPEKDSLYFKFQGPTRASLEESARIAKQIVEKHGGSGFQLAADDQEAADLWQDRKNALYSSLALVPGSRGWSTDVWWVLNVVQVTRVMIEPSANQCSGLPFTGLGICDEEGYLRLRDCIHYRRTCWRWCAMVRDLDTQTLKHCI